jgi:hypothetical protein
MKLFIYNLIPPGSPRFRCKMDEFDSESFEVEMEKKSSTICVCSLCEKTSVVFTLDDWAKFNAYGVCFRCYVEKIQ